MYDNPNDRRDQLTRVRLSYDRDTELRKAARQLGMQHSVLARELVEAGLDALAQITGKGGADDIAAHFNCTPTELVSQLLRESIRELRTAITEQSAEKLRA
ncbi:hypothetical protein WG219_11295 [Ectopseudomonas mendocina]|uniref:Ribbon-helix-helix protein CopG domain-containing protein n=1 Tax=Ectopseudomonas mendocina TaxID=300 RepID=A0ABZ2RA99_ECTME